MVKDDYLRWSSFVEQIVLWVLPFLIELLVISKYGKDEYNE